VVTEQPDDAFAALVAPHRAELHAHCYRMLGSVHDADDALQDALLGAWRGLPGFANRGPLRAWLYRITTNACLQLIAQRPRRLLTSDSFPPADPTQPVEPPASGPWLEPYVEDPDVHLERRESLELAFTAALQHLPATQRAVLLLCEVMEFPASEVATLLDTSVASVNSALQRARKAIEERVPAGGQQAQLRALGDDGQQHLVTTFVQAWERADVPALLAMLTEDVRFTMPPLPSWFDGRQAVGRFLSQQVFATPWRLIPLQANGQLGFACYQGPTFQLGALNVLTLRDGAIAAISAFLDPALYARFGLPISFR
jgi:RNA polymerase sigma-70 factor (ECF subfamily)